jgi:hypothetical protein
MGHLKDLEISKYEWESKVPMPIKMYHYTPRNEVVEGMLVSPCPYVCRQILCRTITWVVFLRIFLKFYQLFTGEERRIPLIFDDFHFCRSRVIGLDITENRIFTLCRMITWVVFLRMFWNFISSLPVKRGGSLSLSLLIVVLFGFLNIKSVKILVGWTLLAWSRNDWGFLPTRSTSCQRRLWNKTRKVACEVQIVWLVFQVSPWRCGRMKVPSLFP